MVVIPAFNRFNGDFQLWDVVSKVSAYNFNAAIHEGRLVVEVDDPSTDDGNRIGVRRLDRDTLRGVLEEESEHVRSARKGSFFGGLRPSGLYAHAAWRTLSRGIENRVTTSLGEIGVWLLEPAPTGSTRVDLYRNGMWITDNVLGLKRADFSSRRPFHAVLMLDRHNPFHRLVRKAEGPMHDALDFARLSRKERTALREAFRETGKWIKSKISKLSTEDYTPDDFLVVEAGGDGPGNASTNKVYSLWGTPVVVQRPPPGRLRAGTDVDDGLPPGRGKTVTGAKDRRKKAGGRRTTPPLPFRSTAVPNGDGRYVIALECREPVDELLLSLRVDENTDATCDRVWPDEDVRLRAFRVKKAGGQSQAADGQLTPDRKAVRLSGLSAGRVYEVTVEHEATREGLDGGVKTAALRVDLRRPMSTGDDDGNEG